MQKASLIVAFVLFSAAILPAALAQENVITGEVTRTFSEIKSSLPKLITEIVLAPAGTPVYEIKLDTNTKILQGRISLEQATLETAGISATPGGAVYSYFNVSGKNIEDSDLDYLTFKFRVANSWLESNKVDAPSVRALRFSSGQWDVVETSVIEVGENSTSYEAKPNGFAIFAIAGESRIEAPAQPTETIGEKPTAAESGNTAESGGDVQEIAPQQDITQDNGENNGWIVGGVLVAAIVAALFLMPGSVLKKIRKKKSRHPWKSY